MSLSRRNAAVLQVASCHLTGTRPMSVSSCCEERWTLGWAKCWTARVVKRTQAGSFVMLPGHMRHFAWVRGETIMQVYGVGTCYINTAEDPAGPGPVRPPG